MRTIDGKNVDKRAESRVTELIERLGLQAFPPRVNREKRNLDNVTVLREVSRNGYRYDPAALKRAAEIFEGARSFLDHGSHSVRDLAGRLHNLVLDSDADGAVLKGTLSVIPGPTGDWLLDIAENMPDMVGLSIVAQGRVEKRGEEVVVAELLGIRSVDIVAEPASTRGLFESAAASPTLPHPVISGAAGEEMHMKDEPGGHGDSQEAEAVSESRRLRDEALTDWLACLLVERLGSGILDERLLEELERAPRREDFARRLVERLKLAAGNDSPRATPGSHPALRRFHSSPPTENIHSARADELRESLIRALSD